ncbi:MAG TPA: FAD-dependent monooxygenase [Candidatus Binatia bacterium]|jgi:2-polyprenyl-6-methoxyphenol hydroxylase-like FAD-dependent oxidoreductase|nr:FAD-dependent monooxygenase [Candidatus Binatia bacterium]
MRSTSPDVLVVGAGPVGLTATADLLRHGVSCRLIDVAPAATDKSKALVLWSRSLELLDDMGIVAPFLAAGQPAHGISMYADAEPLLHMPLTIDSAYGYALMIPQCDTERLLTEHLTEIGTSIERGTALVSFTPDDTGVTAKLRHPDGTTETVRTAWLVGCDGAHSTVRHGLGLDFTGAAETNDWMLADVHLAGPIKQDEVSIFFHSDGVLVIFPIHGDRYRVIADLGPAAPTERAADPSLGDVQRMVDRRAPIGLTVRDPVWLAGFRINERKVARYRHGRVLLAGDAAHIHSPAGGQGMNTGMQDAYNLGWKLALVQQGHAQDVLLDTYSDERSAVGEMVLRQAALLTRAATMRNPIAQRLRNHLYSLLGSIELVRHKIGETMAELSVNYRQSALSAESRGLSAAAWLLGGGVAPGDRMPDAPLTDARSGASTSLYDVMRGTRHVLLLLAEKHDPASLAPLAEAVDSELVTSHVIIAGDALPPWNGPVWRDREGALHKTLGAHGPTAYLIRPDNYVGWRSQPADAAALAVHLAGYLKSGTSQRSR